MATLCRFVSDIASSPTTNLDLNDSTRASGFMIGAAGLGLNPPPLRRSSTSTMMRDGELYPATAYGNRTIRIPLEYVGSTLTDDAATTAFRNLLEELDKPTNVLQVQMGGTTQPVFFKTFRSDMTLEVARNIVREGHVTLEIPAQPFALGTEQTAFNGLISADPTLASSSAPTYFDLTGILGDVPTPPIIFHNSGVNSLGSVGGNGWNGRYVLYARRTRGTPSAMAYFIQAENASMINVTGMSTVTDALLSGGSGRRFTPPNTSQQVCLRGPITTTAASSQLAGSYRILAAVRVNVASDTFYLQAAWGFAYSVSNPEVWVSPHDGSMLSTPILIDLGVVDMGALGMTYGETKTQRVADPMYIEVRARRASGTGTLDFDYFLAVPADEGMAIVDHYTGGSSSYAHIVDGVNDIGAAVLGTTGALQRISTIRGGVPDLIPGVTNRYWVIPGLNTDVYPANSYSTKITYYPRYLFVPGATL